MKLGTLRQLAVNMREQICDSKRTPDELEPPSSTGTKSEYFSSGDQTQARQLKRNLRASQIEHPLEVNSKTPREDETQNTLKSTGSHYGFDFYNIPCVELSKKLLGKVLVRHLADDTVVQGRIVETEAYLGGEDKASQSYQGKRTERNTPMFMKPGTSYVYLTYGMYHCFNISSQGDGAAVLIRAVEPLEGLDHMSERRVARRKPSSKNPVPGFKKHELCNGPAKLTISFDIDKETCNKIDLCEGGALFVKPGDDVPEDRIIITSRIGIESAGVEWASKPLRFYEFGNASVSKRDKKAEALKQTNNSS